MWRRDSTTATGARDGATANDGPQMARQVTGIAGALDGQAVWMRIRKAVLELLKRGKGETVH